METSSKNHSHKEIWIAIVVGFLGMGALIYFSQRWQFASEDSLKGQPAPEIEFESPDGKQLSVSKQRGSVILLNFWASWCQPCLDEMPSLRALENHFEKEGLVILAFNLEGNPETMKGKISSDKMPRNLIFQFKKELLRPYNVNTIPLSVLIDREGTVQQVYSGPRDWVSIETIKEVGSLLKN